MNKTVLFVAKKTIVNLIVIFLSSLKCYKYVDSNLFLIGNENFLDAIKNYLNFQKKRPIICFRYIMNDIYRNVRGSRGYPIIFACLNINLSLFSTFTCALTFYRWMGIMLL
jgi:hypothetical protein